MTASLAAVWFFPSNQDTACRLLQEPGEMPQRLSKNGFNRRLHQIPEALWQGLFPLLAQRHQQTNPDGEYIVAICLVPVRDNLRLKRWCLYRGEDGRGVCASKRDSGSGITLPLRVTASGQPVERMLTSGAVNATPGRHRLLLDLPAGRKIDADEGSRDDLVADTRQECGDLPLIAARKTNSKRSHPRHLGSLCQVIRNRVETTWSGIAEHFAKSIHAVTARGIEWEVFLTVLAYSISR